MAVTKTERVAYLHQTSRTKKRGSRRYEGGRRRRRKKKDIKSDDDKEQLENGFEKKKACPEEIPRSHGGHCDTVERRVWRDDVADSRMSGYLRHVIGKQIQRVFARC